MGTDIAHDIPATMRAWRVTHPAPIETNPLEYVTVPVPVPGPGELLVRVRACGVCRTDLHVSEGDLPVHLPHVTPGHEVVAEVVQIGEEITASPHENAPGASARPDSFAVGDRVGVAWLRHVCGICKYCRAGHENLCPYSQYTGWDANGGYAEYATVPADFAYRLPEGYEDAELAPLLCAGIIGYRSLKRTDLPDGGVLGIYGFGGSAHLTAQVALAGGARVHVLTRDVEAQKLALELGCASAAGAYDAPPEPLDAAILFAPVGDLVPVALRALDRGGILACAGIYLSDIHELHYEQELFYEKQLRSVTSNTRADGEEFLAFAATHRLTVDAHTYPLAEGQHALRDLKAGAFTGAAVLVP